MTEPAHILIVDDDSSIRRMLQLLLSDAGYRVSTTATGEEALSYVELVTPDLILLDMMLPGIGGLEVAQRVKGNPARPFIPIILITARNDSQSKVNSLDAGADDFLSKPVDFSELLARVRALLRLQRSQRSLRTEQRKTELLLHLTRELNTTLNMDDLLTNFLGMLCDAIGSVRASIILTLGDRSRLFSSSRFATSITMQDILNNGVAGWVLREMKPLVIADTRTDSRWLASNSYHQIIRSVAAVPIQRDGQMLGVITVVHHTPNHFSEEHLNLLELVAQQSAFTLQNAELYRLTRIQNDLLERRAEELQRINEVSRHLSELMQPNLLMNLVTHLIHHNFGYPQVSIYLKSASGLRAQAVAGQVVPEGNSYLSIPTGQGLTNWVYEHRKSLNVGDVTQDERYFAYSKRDTVRSELAVPIYAGRELYGVLDVASPKLNAFDTNDERLLDTLASQLGVALDNSRLFDNEKRRVQQLGQANGLSIAITAQLDRARNLEIAAQELCSIFNLPRSAIASFDKIQQRFSWSLHGDWKGNNPEVASRQTDVFNVFLSTLNGPELLLQPLEDPRFERYVSLFEREVLSAIAIAPLISGGNTIGVVLLDLGQQAANFSHAELTLLGTVTNLISQVLENDRLYREVEDERGTLNAVLDGAADPILLISPQDKLLLANRAADRRLGLPPMAGVPLTNYIHQGDLLRALGRPTNGHGPYEVTLDDATTFSVSVASVHSSQNGELGRVAVMQDITAIKELERREQERLRGALRRYVSPQVVEQVLAGGSDFGTPVEINVAVLFADLRSYTSLTEGIDPHVLVNTVLNRYFTAMTEVLYRHEGTIDKFLGDGILGVFGTPLAHTDDLERALLAAVDMQRAFWRLHQEWKAELGLEIGMGVGIGYGPAVVGNIGSTQRTDFTLVGDVVNTTSRLSGVARAGQIVVSHRLVDALPRTWNPPFTLREMGRIPLKGKQEPHLTYDIDYLREMSA